MRLEVIDIEKLRSNSGQIEGLPANPRKWDADDVKRLAKSIEETPELLEARPPIVVRHDGNYVVLGGNMRLEACRYLDYEEMPCAVMDEDTPIETLKQIVVKDNSSFGEWDFSKLKDEWDEMPLGDWGVLGYDSYIKSLEKKETEKLSQLKFDTPYYQPTEKPQISLEDCVDKTLFEAKVAFIEESKLTKRQKAVMKLFAYRFLRIDFQSVADYYAFNATEEERQVLERLRLVLVDGGGIRGFVEDGLLKVAGLEAGDDGDE